MTEQMYITPSNNNEKSHIRDTRYFSSNENISENIKKMMELDIIRDLALKNMENDKTISYEIAHKLAKDEFYGEEIEIPIPPIEIEETFKIENNNVEDEIKDISNIEKLSDQTDEIIIPEINIETDINLPLDIEKEINKSDSIETLENLKEELNNGILPSESLIVDENEKDLENEETLNFQTPISTTESINNTEKLMTNNDQLIDNLLEIDTTNNLSELNDILINNEELLTQEPITQKTR